MRLLVYGNGSNDAGKRLQDVIDGVAPEIDTEIYRTVENLSSRLRRRLGDLAVVVLYAASRKELQEILQIRDLLDDVPVLLILPDREAETFSEGLNLFPRFISFEDTDFTDVSAVLGRMLKVYSSKYANQ